MSRAAEVNMIGNIFLSIFTANIVLLIFIYLFI